MSKYKIKTKNFNMFTGTRAEAIVADLGNNKRIAAGMILFVLPAVATLRDLDIINPENSNIPIEVAVDSLEPASAMKQYFTPDQFFYGMLSAFYKVELNEYPKTENPVIIVVDMINEAKKMEKGFGAEEDYAENIKELLCKYRSAEIIFTYSGKTSASPEKRIMKTLSDIAGKSHCINTKGHNPFFNTYLAEMICDLNRKEIVVVGKNLNDKVFYTAVNAKDLENNPCITVLPNCVIPELRYGSVITEKFSGLEILTKHLTETLNVGIKTGMEIPQKERTGATIYLE